MMFTLAEALPWLPGARLVGDGATPIARVHTDSRTLAAGDLFVALRGERFDAHAFLPEARAKGAVAAIAHGGLVAAGLPGIEVSDTQVALAQLASGWRRRFAMPLIAVAGSNGKTTVTQMIAAILRAWKPGAMLSTEGNFNNHIGVPLTLLRLYPGVEVAVVELGMNHPGEIAQLAAIAMPTVALVNNAQREHQEFMASVQAVAEENGAVIAALKADGVAVFPADDDYSAVWDRIAGARRVLRFAFPGSDPRAAITASAEWRDGGWALSADTPAGRLNARVAVAGRHNVRNALAATAATLAAGAPLAAIAEGLSAFQPVKGRSRLLSVPRAHGALTLIDDTYNANPDSVRAAIDVLAELPAPRLLVLGDMGEVGSQGPQFHAEIGAYARERGVDRLLAIGDLCVEAVRAFGQGALHFSDMENLKATVLQTVPQTCTALVKGSRFMKMERIVDAVLTAQPAAPHIQESTHAA